MSRTVSSYMRSGSGTVARKADILPLPFPARPQAMTIYTRHVNLGTSQTGTSTRLWQISKINDTNPRLLLFNSSGKFAIQLINLAGSAVTSTLADSPSVGSGIELVAQLSAAGTIKLLQSLDSAAETETSESAALRLESSWGAGALLFVNSINSSFVGFIALRNLIIHRGVQSLDTMRRLAGV